MEAAVVDTDLEIFQQLLKELEAQKFDLNVLVRSSKRYPSLLEYAVNNKNLKVAGYLMKHFTFRNKEIISAYSLLSSSLNVSYTGWVRVCSNRVKKDDPVKLYQEVIYMIDIIPEGIKKKVVEVFLRGILNYSSPVVLREVLDHIPGGITELEEYDGVVERVIDSSNEDAMQVLIECLGLRVHMMDEDPYGYTVVERVMKKYMDAVTSNNAVRIQKSEGSEERERMEEEKLNEEAKQGENEAALVALKRKMKSKEGCISNMLDMVLRNADGLPRSLTTSDAVQKRVKKDSEEASANNFGHRLCLGSRTRGETEYTYRQNVAMNKITQMPSPVEHN